MRLMLVPSHRTAHEIVSYRFSLVQMVIYESLDAPTQSQILPLKGRVRLTGNFSVKFRLRSRGSLVKRLTIDPCYPQLIPSLLPR